MADQPSSDQIEEWKEAFQLFDKDGDGKVTQEEFGTVLRALGQNPTQAEIKQIIKELGGPAQVDFAQFSAIMQKRKKPDLDEQIKQAFKVFDTKNTGLIDVGELKHILVSVGERLAPDEVDTILKEADADHDGKINFQDFQRVMKVTSKA
eukprot:TRINITY_DN511_c0_g1_i2.p2 TRINITY_DN511_c0_g1~~TRINITY_DN511_c0_g1_i2.p2  ORF type:complete len:150 (-),score=37.75 TRINITY_DN511_c0_g1_i2:157-606(-)